MNRFRNIKDHNIESRLFFHRTIWMLMLIAILISIIIGRQIYLQVFKHAKYETDSQTNYLKFEPDPPVRGLIYDRNRNLLVENTPSYNLEITPERVQVPCVDYSGEDKPKKMYDKEACIRLLLRRIHRLFYLSNDDLNSFWKKYREISYRHFSRVPLRYNLTDEEVAKIAARRHRFPSISISRSIIRHYIYSNSLSHIIGYVREADKKIINSWTDKQKENYRGTTHVGVKGIEKQYEQLLHGQVGQLQVERNVHGRKINQVLVRPSIPGKNIHLTIDVRLQTLAEKLLGDKAGSVVALDPNNGEILALVSKPGYDPNDFVTGLSKEKYKKLRQDPKKPLLPRALVSAYPPGSTIKPFYGLAGLYYGAIEPENSISCRGKFYLPGVKRPWRDWKKEGHGKVNLQVSIMRSCDVYYYKLAVKLGIDKITSFLKLFGIGAKTGIDMPQEKRGVLPSRAYKVKRFSHLLKKRPAVTKWFTGDTVSVGIGQGYITVTPMQLALATSAIAMRGRMMQPRLLYAEENANNNEILYTQPRIKRVLTHIKKHHWNHIVDDMVTVVHKKWAGTAWRIATLTEEKYQIAGKTGTAQVVKQTAEDVKRKQEEIPENERDHALFISFAPADKPKIVVVVLAEHGGHGSSGAAPIAGKVIQAYMRILANQPIDGETQEITVQKKPELTEDEQKTKKSESDNTIKTPKQKQTPKTKAAPATKQVKRQT